MNELLVNRTRDLGLSTGHADTAEELLDEILDQLEVRERKFCKHGKPTEQYCADCQREYIIDNATISFSSEPAIKEVPQTPFRERLICAALTGLVDSMEYFPEKLAKEAIGYADAVLKTLEKE